MWMGRGSSSSNRSKRKTSKLWWPSAIPAWGCPRSRGTRSSRRSLPPNLTARVWDYLSAARSLSHMAAACGLPTTLRAEPVFISPYPPKPRHTIEDRDPVARIAALLTVSASITGGERNNGNENSEVGRPGNSWSLHGVVEFLQDGNPCLHCIAFIASGRLYSASHS